MSIGEAMMVHSTRNTDGETQLLTLPFSFKIDPKDLHKSNAFPTDHYSGMPEPQYLRNMIIKVKSWGCAGGISK